MNPKEQQRAKLEGLLTPPAQSINNYYPAEKPVTQPIAWLIGAIALPTIAITFLFGLQSGYGRAAHDVAAAQSQAAIAQSKVQQAKACMEAVQ